MVQLSRNSLKNISPAVNVLLPDERLFSLPEKVLQFGTGVLLRGLPDYFIDKANRKGIFNGRVVMVKSTASGNKDMFGKQDNLYTLCVRGIENDKKIEEFIINSSISRVFSAQEDWKSVLKTASSPELKIIISNTTEIGIKLSSDDISLLPPHSFPGKLLSFLYERFKAFNGRSEGGMVIIPTELIPDNGSTLRSIILELAKMNELETDFLHWLKTSNHFCNSLVDRIVPGPLEKNDLDETEKKLGYSDELMIMSEPFRLWAIESANDSVREILSFSKADEGVVVAPDIEKFRELKLRLLNGAHTFSCGLAVLAGFKTVRQAMDNRDMRAFMEDLTLNEITGAIYDQRISYDEARSFGKKVIERFRNPFIDHQWINIAVQYSSKMKMRNIPLLVQHFQRNKHIPNHMALGFAAYLLYMRCRKDDKNGYVGKIDGFSYQVQDDFASYFSEKWIGYEANEIVDRVLEDKEFWGVDLASFPGFAESVKIFLRTLMEKGVLAVLSNITMSKSIVGP